MIIENMQGVGDPASHVAGPGWVVVTVAAKAHRTNVVAILPESLVTPTRRNSARSLSCDRGYAGGSSSRGGPNEGPASLAARALVSHARKRLRL